MNFYDNEEKIINTFRDIPKSEVYFATQTAMCFKIFNSIYKSKHKDKWINNSGKSDPPPDFYSEEFGLMMEVMRVDDHAHYNDKGVLINPINIRESILQKEIRDKIKSGNPDIDLSTIDIVINAASGLSSNEDHNYRYYYDSFKRVLEKHIGGISLYRKNHPNKKLVFFVFDESTGYVVVDNKDLVERGPVALEWFKANPLWHFCDERFISVFKDADIDYLIWFTPYKMFHGSPIQPPKVCVFDVKKLKKHKTKQYPIDYIISSEA